MTLALRYLGHRPQPGIGHGNFASGFVLEVGHETVIGRDPVRVGRDRDAGLRVVSNAVGRIYAWLTLSPEGDAIVADISGSQPAYRNGERLPPGPSRLVVGDVLSIADSFDFQVVQR